MDKLRMALYQLRPSKMRRKWWLLKHRRYSQNGFALLWLVVVSFAGFASWRVNQFQPGAIDRPESITASLSAESAPTPAPPAPKPAESVPPVPPPAPEDMHQFGLSAGDLVNFNASELDARLTNFNELGVTWIRLDIPWSVVQGDGAASYEWESYDRVIDAANKHRLRVLVVLDYTPAWARPANCQENQYCAPGSHLQFAHYAGTVVNRYKDKGVKHWEVWNEPNHRGFWNPQPNASAYATLLKATYAVIKREDPSAVVITGGLSPAFTDGTGDIAPAEFLTALYANGAKDSFDAVAHHPYSYPALPTWGERWNGWMQMQELKNVMNANGDVAKLVWITEYGAPTNGPGAIGTLNNFNFSNRPDHVDEDLQAEMVKQSIALYRSYDWVGPMIWYHYQDKGTTNDTNENFFGLLRPDGSKKAAYGVLQAQIKR
jgi:hypothetical protein